jgi:hypothetical protein
MLFHHHQCMSFDHTPHLKHFNRFPMHLDSIKLPFHDQTIYSNLHFLQHSRLIHDLAISIHHEYADRSRDHPHNY